LIELAASASYIAVPAAIEMVLPHAQPGARLRLSPGVTMQFTIMVGLQLCLWLAGT
jgi:hypothetical protein